MTLIFLSSANEVGTGPTCQKVSVRCLSGCPVVFSKLLIGGPTCFWQWFWHRDVDIEVIEVIEVAQLKEKKKEMLS